MLVLNGGSFTFDFAAPYVLSLLYLSVFGTVLAFAFYFILLKDIGPELASYTVVLFPVVAVALSIWFEGFELQPSSMLGFILVLSGNVIVLTPFRKIKALLLPNKAVQPVV